jgi:hypothetical protein
MRRSGSSDGRVRVLERRSGARNDDEEGGRGVAGWERMASVPWFGTHQKKEKKKK